MATVAKAFNLSPLQAARDLDEDPDLTILGCLELLGYANVKAAVEQVKGDPKRLRGLPSDLVATVTKNTFDLTRLAFDHHKGHPTLPGGPECWLCLGSS